MAKSKSSNDWLREHFDDPYVKKAQKAGYRSRATFKLEEIDKKDKLHTKKGKVNLFTIFFPTCLNAPKTEVRRLSSKFFTANILFWEYLGVVCFRPKNQRFL